MRHLDNEKGFIKPLLWIIVLVILIYSGIQFGMPYYRYQMLKADAKEFARSELGNVEKTKAKLAESAENLKIPIKADDITVSKTKDLVRVRTSWSETVDLMGFYQKTLQFEVNIEE